LKAKDKINAKGANIKAEKAAYHGGDIICGAERGGGYGFGPTCRPPGFETQSKFSPSVLYIFAKTIY
jgi:hypothetical protein